MAHEETVPTWRNVASWSALAAVVYTLTLWAAATLLHQDPIESISRSSRAVVPLALALIFSTAIVGFANRKRPLSERNFRNFLIQNAGAIAALLLVIRGFQALARTGTVSNSEWVAAVIGATLLALGVFGGIVTASAHSGLNLIDDEMAAEDVRERGRMFFYSYLWTAAFGLLLIGLSLAGSGTVLSPAAVLAGAFGLIVILAMLGIATWRLLDELGRTLSREAGNVAFHLILIIGGGWAILAHLGFMAPPAPLDWLSLLTVLLFGASIIAVGRRRLITR